MQGCIKLIFLSFISYVKCWGYNDKGQLGIGETYNRGDDSLDMGDNLPILYLGSDASENSLKALKISVGNDHACALMTNYSLKCWGNNEYGQLGQGNQTNHGDTTNTMSNNLLPIQLGTDENTGEELYALTVKCGNGYTCAKMSDYTYKCWGVNNYGQLGLGHTRNIGDNEGEMGNNLESINLGELE
ncbi:MAG: hypothetical protein ABIA04_15900 [Pseudomonadota bacterium]